METSVQFDGMYLFEFVDGHSHKIPQIQFEQTTHCIIKIIIIIIIIGVICINIHIFVKTDFLFIYSVLVF